MHRLLVVKLFPDSKEKFKVVADSSNPKVSEDNPISIREAGGSEWSVWPDELPEYSSFKLFPLPCKLKISELGFWHVNKTDKAPAEFDFAANGFAELKTVVDGELHLEYEGRSYCAAVGDSIIFWMDPNDKKGRKIRPYLVKFKAGKESTIVYTEYHIS